MVDFRANPSASPEGAGRARRAWDAYSKRVNAVALPVLEPAIARVSRDVTIDLLGFWMMWHLHGGFEGLVEFGMHPSTVWRKVKRFRMAFGEHPDVFRFPGVTIDPEAYWEAARQAGNATGE